MALFLPAKSTPRCATDPNKSNIDENERSHRHTSDSQKALSTLDNIETATLFVVQTKARVVTKHIYNPLLEAKARVSIETLRACFVNEIELTLDEGIRARARAIIVNTKLTIGDSLHLGLRSSTWTRGPPRLLTALTNRSEADARLVYDTETASNARLVEFETLAFGNRVVYQYHGDIPFSEYLYKNLLYSQGVDDITDVSRPVTWQAKLARILEVTDRSDTVARLAFYDPIVVHACGGIRYKRRTAVRCECLRAYTCLSA